MLIGFSLTVISCGPSQDITASKTTSVVEIIKPSPTPLPPEIRSAPTRVPSKIGRLPLPAPTQPTSPSPIGGGYDSNKTMYLLFSGRGHSPSQTMEGLGAAQAQQDKSLVPVIIEMLRFLPSQDLVEEAGFTLQLLTGATFDGMELNSWGEWLSKNIDGYQPPTQYPDWKINLLSLIDPVYSELLESARGSTKINLVELIWGGIPVNGIPDLNNPLSVPAKEAGFMKPDDRVFGISINGEHRAYPHRILNPHEMANDTVGGEEITLAYCALCGAGIVYSSKIEQEPTTFGTSGLLYRSNKIMFDRKTNSLWHQFTGEPIAGPLADGDFKLYTYPVVVTTWEEWVASHPDTTVVSIETNIYPSEFYLPESNPQAVYHNYFNSPEIMFPVADQDDRLQAKQVIFGLSLGNIKKAYLVRDLIQRRVVNDSIGETTVVIVASERSGSARAYASENNVFSISDGQSPDGVSTMIVDSNSIKWRVTEGHLSNTDDPSQKLDRIPAHTSFWFSWYQFHRNTDLYIQQESP